MLRLLVCTLLAAAVATADYEFSMNGEHCEPFWMTLGDGPHPGPGDLVRLNGWVLLAEQPGRYELTGNDDVLHLSRDGGPRRTVGLGLYARPSDPTVKVPDPLQGLTRDQLHEVRCLRIDDPIRDGKAVWTPALLDPEALDWDRLVVLIDHMALGERANPLPLGATRRVRHLITGSGSAGGGFTFDLALLASEGTLVFADLYASGAAPIRGEWLASHRGLRRLVLRAPELTGAQAMSALSELRHLDISYADAPLDLSCTRGLHKLETATFSQTPLGDLGPLLELPRLTIIAASGAPIAALPPTEARSLLRLEAVGCGLDSDQIAAFSAKNPQTEVLHSYTACLLKMAAQADSLVLRTGGTCHRNQAKERILYRTVDRDEIALLASSLNFDDHGSGFHCMCCGDGALEFRHGEVLLATLAMHHGRSLRWAGSDVPWPGDGLLQPASASTLCAWLASHGHDRPLQELQAEREREAAGERMRAAYLDILGAETLEALRKSTDAKGQQEALARRWPATADCTLGLLRLFGAGRRSWMGQFGIDALVDGLEATAVAPVAAAALTQDDSCDGLARWAFELDRLGSLPAELRQDIAPRLAARGLADPRSGNRRTTLIRLDACPEGWATEALRQALAGISPRPIAESEHAEPGGQQVYRPRPWSPAEQASDRAVAAVALARRGDTASLPAIRALSEGANAADGKLIVEALGLLEPKPAR